MEIIECLHTKIVWAFLQGSSQESCPFLVQAFQKVKHNTHRLSYHDSRVRPNETHFQKDLES